MSKELLQSPVQGRTVPAVLAKTVARVPDKGFITCGEDSLTSREFDLTVNRFANFIASLGAQGGKFAIMLPNCLEFVYGWFGCAKLAVVFVPINPEYRGEILRHQLAKADVTHILIDAAYLDRLAEVAPALPKLATVIVNGPDAGCASAVAALSAGMRVVGIDAFRGFPDAAPGVVVKFTDKHSISFTSGTTGPSKGALSTHCHAVSFSFDWIEVTRFTEDDVIYAPMPLFHALGSVLGVLPTVICGARIALAPRFSASTYWDEVRKHGATIAHGIFSMVPVLMKQPERPDDSDNPARVYYIGQRNEAFERRFGVKIINAFGATETGAVAYTPYEEEAPEGSCGRPNAFKYDVRIVDDDDQEVEAGQVGEIIARGKAPFMMMDGYYNDPAATLEAFRNQWFHTGDNGRRDADGWYYFVDRKKDAIRRRGENIASFDIESVVNQHPAVLESAAVAMPSELGEDDVKVFVVRRQGASLAHEELMEFCAARMPAFWLPRIIEFIGEMPRTPTQKIMKYRLRENVENGERREFDLRARKR
jgi:crotonobetaine/carnitine-CoA ligase